MAGTSRGRPFDMGRVFRNGFAVFNRWPVTLLATGVLITLPTALATDWATLHLIGPRPAAGDLAATWRRLGLLEVVGVAAVGMSWLQQGAVALCAGATEAGQDRLDYGALTAKLLARLPALYLLGVAATLATAVGLLLFIIPGLIVGLALSMGPIVAVREEQGLFEVLGRSWRLTAGYRIQLFGISLVLSLASGALGLLARGALGVPLLSNATDYPAYSYVAQPAISAISAPIIAAISAATYTELRTIKEGATRDQVAQTFG